LSPDRCANASELHVTAAGAFEHVLHALAEPFREKSGSIIRLSITNAGGVIRKIEADEPADVVLTSSAGIDALAAKGRLDPATKVEVGRMRLGVAVNPSAADPDLATADTLRAAGRAWRRLHRSQRRRDVRAVFRHAVRASRRVG